VLHHAAARFFEDIHLSLWYNTTTGMLAAHVANDGFAANSSLTLLLQVIPVILFSETWTLELTNDSHGRPTSQVLAWQDGKVLKTFSVAAGVLAAQAGTTLWQEPLSAVLPPACTPGSCFLHAQLLRSGGSFPVSEADFFPGGLANATLPSAGLAVTLAPGHAQLPSSGCIGLVVSSTAPAVFVTLETPFFGRFSDNSYTLLPGQPRAVCFLPWDTLPPRPADLLASIVAHFVN
jgi:hypothetical protein